MATLTLAPFLQIRFEDPLCCELPLDGRRIELRDERYVELLGLLGESLPRAEVIRLVAATFALTDADANVIVDDLVREGILQEEGDRTSSDSAIAHWEARGWIDALRLHGLSRNIAFADDGAVDPGELHDRLFGDHIRRQPPPQFWKDSGNRPRISLSEGEVVPDARTFEEVLMSRRSNQPWTGEPLGLDRLSTIVRLANRETRRLRTLAEQEWRSRPGVLLKSAFAATETYLFVFDVAGLEPGLYHYDPLACALTQLRGGSLRHDVAVICAGQERPSQASCVFAITAVFERYMYRYRHERAYRSLLINVAELAQKYIMASTAFQLSTFLTPLFDDERAAAVLGLDPYEEALLEIVAVG
jgi:SagB-type dehydrogenase family enzyme